MIFLSRLHILSLISSYTFFHIQGDSLVTDDPQNDTIRDGNSTLCRVSWCDWEFNPLLPSWQMNVLTLPAMGNSPQQMIFIWRISFPISVVRFISAKSTSHDGNFKTKVTVASILRLKNNKNKKACFYLTLYNIFHHIQNTATKLHSSLM